MWLRISRAAGLLIVLVVLALLAAGRTARDVVTVQTLLGIAAGLLGFSAIFSKRNGSGK